jgi:hypothetical protein
MVRTLVEALLQPQGAHTRSLLLLSTFFRVRWLVPGKVLHHVLPVLWVHHPSDYRTLQAKAQNVANVFHEHGHLPAWQVEGMGLRTPPVDASAEEGTIHVWQANIDNSSQAQ